jgi:hypothetical protein
VIPIDGGCKAAVGFCFGGLDAVVCLHGDLATTMPAARGSGPNVIATG